MEAEKRSKLVLCNKEANRGRKSGQAYNSGKIAGAKGFLPFLWRKTQYFSYGFLCSKAGFRSFMIGSSQNMDTQFVGWRVMLVGVLDSIDGATYNIDGEKGLVQITGRINPGNLMKTLTEVGLHADLSRVSSEYGETNIPSRHGYGYLYNGSYDYNPYRKPEYYQGYPQQQRNWHPMHENYLHYLPYNQNYPSYELQAEYFSQPPPQPEGFRNSDTEWCTIM
ncbi:hypothetical protein V6N13_129383 [Hibiscus sabdariffa]